MKAEFKVETRVCNSWDKVLVVTNYQFSNLITNWPMMKYDKIDRSTEDVGMWRVKTFKK